MTNPGVLVVIRGNSGSGKSTVATAVQRRFDRGTCTHRASETAFYQACSTPSSAVSRFDAVGYGLAMVSLTSGPKPVEQHAHIAAC
ncbi:hypothetical protein [Nocardia sp. NPDC051570]|uniref:hypothetical protein n=1 Tax=Nocardia sp. NPDC051570 TaxID=3364324 RepID=UPI00378FC96E